MDGLNLLSELARSKLGQLDNRTRSELLTTIVAADSQMRALGRQARWDGDTPPEGLINSPVVVETERGPMFGETIYFGLREVGDEFMRTVLVLLPSSGSVYEALPSQVRRSTTEDVARMARELEMKERLPAVLARPSASERPSVGALRVHAERVCDRARELGLVVDQKSAFTKVTGPAKRRAVYVSRRGGRIDLSGFCVEHPGVRVVTPEDARRQHLGSVKAQVLFEEPSAEVDLAVEAVLAALVSA